MGPGRRKEWIVRDGHRCRTNRAVQRMPFLPLRALLDVHAAHHFWVQAATLRWHGAATRFCPKTLCIHRVPESLSEEEAAYIEPAACAWHAVDRGEIKEATSSSSAESATSDYACSRSPACANPGMVIASDCQTVSPGDRLRSWGGPVDQCAGGRRGPRVRGFDRRIWLRCLYRGQREPGGHRFWSADDPQTWHIRRIQRFQ